MPACLKMYKNLQMKNDLDFLLIYCEYSLEIIAGPHAQTIPMAYILQYIFNLYIVMFELKIFGKYSNNEI